MKAENKILKKAIKAIENQTGFDIDYKKDANFNL